MSRVGRSPIPLPSGVEVDIQGRRVSVKGPKGALVRELPGEITVRRADGALHGLARSLVNNMVVGVTEGFTKELGIVGVGYRATAQGPSRLELAVGYSHTVPVDAPDGVTFEVPQPTRITVRGIDKEAVGQVAADIRAVRKPEPYK